MLPEDIAYSKEVSAASWHLRLSHCDRQGPEWLAWPSGEEYSHLSPDGLLCSEMVILPKVKERGIPEFPGNDAKGREPAEFSRTEMAGGDHPSPID